MQALGRVAKLFCERTPLRSDLCAATHRKELLSEHIPIIKLGFYTDSNSVFPYSKNMSIPAYLCINMKTHSMCSNTSALRPSVLILSKMFLALRLSCVSAHAS